MDINEKDFFDDFGNLSLAEMRKLFENLKNIGMSQDDIDKYALEYNKFFQKLIADRKEQESLTKKNGTIFIGESNETHQ
jgi:hypothetical protein